MIRLTWTGCAVLIPLASVAPAIDLPPDARVTQIHPNARQFEILRPNEPLAVYGVVIDRKATDLKLVTTANAGSARGRSTLDVQARALATENQVPVAAVNGDFFVMTGTFAGTTIGGMIVSDELFRFADGRPVFATLDDSHHPFIGQIDIDARVTLPDRTTLDIPLFNLPFDLKDERQQLALFSPRWGKSTDTPGDTLEVVLKFDGRIEENQSINASVVNLSKQGDAPILPGTLVMAVHPKLGRIFGKLKPGDMLNIELTSKGAPNLDQMIAGAPVLVKAGKVVQGQDKDLHPRTAVAFDEDHIVLLTVDGRAPGHSRGMTLFELATFLQAIGATEALNLDGGGSTTLWVRGRTVNRPSDGLLRPNPNGLALVTTRGPGEASQIHLGSPSPIRIVKGASLELSPVLTDDQLNPLPGRIQLSPTGNITGNTFTATQAGSHTIHASSGNVTLDIPIEVVEAPAKLLVDPMSLRLLPATRTKLRIEGQSADGIPIILNPKDVVIRVEPALASVTGTTIVAGDIGGRGSVVVSGYGHEIGIPLQIASREPLSNFVAKDASFRGFPETVKGRVDAVEDAAALSWNFRGVKATAAAYANVDRDVTDALALGLSLKAGEKSINARVLVKVAVVDGNGTRQMYNLFEGPLPGDWKRVSVPIPVGLKHPVRWQSVYVVSTDSTEFAQEGQIVMKEWSVMR